MSTSNTLSYSTLAALICVTCLACGPGAPGDSRDAGSDATTEGGIHTPPWQAAIARGVDFRALGQEPGWSLDIDRDGRTIYAGDYGTDTLAAPTPESAIAIDSTAGTLILRADGREMRVRITRRECHDTMSGEAFTHAVALVVDGRELSGCGRWIGAGSDRRR